MFFGLFGKKKSKPSAGVHCGICGMGLDERDTLCPACGGAPKKPKPTVTRTAYSYTPSGKRKRCEYCHLPLSASDTDCPDCGHDPEYY